ncbi:MAG TPA: MaoC family dehydratase N-terminal domain-containing protein [Candidatus Binatia bacterium]|nr:MaoC family dehydratase N-terminal domain-containing protein [Candidatus Binatia bacterium]
MAPEFDRSIIGQVFDETTFPPITKEEILDFTAALGEKNPLYTDEVAATKGTYGGLTAPPTFVTKLRAKKFTPEHLPKFGKVGFDGGRDLEIYAPIRPGDVLTMRSTIHDIYEKTGRTGSMYFIVIRNEVANQKGEKVAVIDHRIMQR